MTQVTTIKLISMPSAYPQVNNDSRAQLLQLSGPMTGIFVS